MNKDFLNLITPMLLMMLMTFGAYFAMLYRRDRRHQNELEMEKVHLEREKLEIEKERKSITEDLTYQSNGNGGYIIFDLKDKSKAMFHDLLSGFEEYAKLRGYKISFSIDTSIVDKVAFKFTLQDSGVNVSTQTVRKDIQDYIAKVSKGENFDDLPVVVSQMEHDLILTTLKNRLNFLQSNYNLEKNSREYYESFLKKIASSSFGFSQAAPIYIQTGGTHVPKSLTAMNSPNALVGDNNVYENNSDNSDHSCINISNSFNKKREQVNKIDELIKLIQQEANIDEIKRQTLLTNFDKIKEEITDEEQPNKSKIFKWLSNTKAILETLVLSHHTVEAVNWVYENLNFVIHNIVTQIPS